MTTILTIYAIVAVAYFLACTDNEPILTRLKLAAIAPLVFVAVGVAWVVTRVKELG